MKELHLFYAPEAPKVLVLPEEESRHALKVLRLQTGDPLFLTDGKGHFFHAEIVPSNNRNTCSFHILETIEVKQSWRGKLHLAVAPTKNIDRTEWLAEKATEIGFDSLTFLNCDYSERTKLNLERIERIMISAIKQSHKAFLPALFDMTKFRQFISHPFSGRKFIAHCYEETDLCPGGKPFLLDALQGEQSDVLVLVGPEGDFSVEEVRLAIEAGFKPISLGQSRLRTETASIVAVHLMNINNSQ